MILDFENLEDSKSKDDKEEKPKENNTKSPSFDCHQFSQNSNNKCFFGALTENKKLLVWEILQEGDIKLVMEL